MSAHLLTHNAIAHMKKAFKLIIPALLASSVLAGCEKFTKGYDISPNLPQGASTTLLLTTSEAALGLEEETNATRVSAIWTQQFTGASRQAAGLDVYQTLASDYDSDWNNYYQLTLTNSRLTEAAAETDKNPLTKGIAQTIEGLCIGHATSLWGDIPYSEAINDAIPKPKFDAQKDVYTQVQAVLADAITNLNKPGSSPGAADIYFGGSATNWLAVANTLRARCYLQAKDYANAAKYAALGIQSPAGNLVLQHPGTADQVDYNLINSFLDQQRPGDITADGAFAPTLLATGRANSKTNEDGRLKYFYALTFVNGVQYGYANVDYEPNIYYAGTTISKGVKAAGNGAFTPSSSYPLVTYEENQLILAEALLRVGITNFSSSLAALNAVRAYHSGANSPYSTNGTVQYDAYVASDFASGGIASYGTANANEGLLKEILTEKYLSLIAQIEPFNDQRRATTLAGTSNTSKSVIGVVPKKGASLPQRFLYPQIEITTNPNTPAQTAADLFTKTSVNQ